MTDPSSDESRLEPLMSTLLGVADGSFDVRAPRSFEGDEWDVLAFLVNSTADEVQFLVRELEAEREELKRAQERLVQSEKLAALGRLAAGVAHEINQPLTVIASMTDLVRLDPSAKVGEREEDLAMIAEAVRQMSGIVDSIRTFGRSGGGQMQEVSALLAVRGAVQLLSTRLQDQQVDLEWQIPDGLPPIVANVDRMRQVFINLIGNAGDAMVAAGVSGPRLTIATGVEGHEIVFRVGDNGPGVASEDLPKIFDPFFSTKPVGEGTGLGLSVALGIVVDHHGIIEYEPTDGGGATFVVRMPFSRGAC